LVEVLQALDDLFRGSDEGVATPASDESLGHFTGVVEGLARPGQRDLDDIAGCTPGAEYLYRFLDTRDIPVQVVWGRQDPITPMPPDEVLRTVFSHADLRPLDGVGHLPHHERPDDTAAIILDFLRDAVANRRTVL
jgi:pimeloyl-ACP methyl ester carboxylesterase